MRVDSLTTMQLDALQELGSIGAGHAATSLAQLVDRPIDISVPVIELLPVTQIPEVFGSPERLVAAAYSRLSGDLGGCILFVAPEESARALADHLHNREAGATVSFGRTEEQLFLNTAHVMASAYLAAVSRMVDMDVLSGEPQFALDMAGAILQIAVVRVGMRADMAILVRTQFKGEGTVMDAALFFMPDPDSLDAVLARLGLV
ncbi:MAG: CheY-P-specific phosphatase CheC [Coriobacteriaceae bacterium]|nr:CheY-P-specific phosphatase CheC [Coriobacteriaceae bacterium]